MAARRIPRVASTAIAIGFVLIAVGTLAGDLAFGALLTPMVFLLGAFAMTRMTLRDSMISLMFLALTLQDPADGYPVGSAWNPPFAGAGEALLCHLNAVARPLGSFGWASFSLMDLFLLTAVVIHHVRTTTRSKLDSHDRLPTPRPLLRLAALAALGTAFTWLWGLATGGDFGKSLWQLNRVMYLPLLIYLFHLGLRGPQDLGALLKVILYAVVYKSLLALFVVFSFEVPMDPATGSTRPPYATSHQDSVLFATGFAAVVVLLLERIGGTKRALKLAMWLLPLIAAGIWANNRRTAWVQVGLVFWALYMLTADNPVKRTIRRALVVLAPVVAIYVGWGWNGGGPLFKPVHTLRSVVDAKSDGSSNWRELENFDILQTIKAYPLLGTGYGHGYLEIIQLPAVSYDLERWCPHNSLLAIWGFAGVVGFTTLTLSWIAGIYFAVRSYGASREPQVRAGALMIIGIMVIYLVQAWGDLGIGSWISVFLVGPALAMAGKLAVHTGQWTDASRAAPARVRRNFEASR